ncbi:MAG TPA: hypothetical protein VGH49_09350 [Xanthobacteraceae bacterium]
MRRYAVALAFVALSAWTFDQIFSALTTGSIWTLAARHAAHRINFAESPVGLVATLVFYVVIGPLLGSAYVWFAFFADLTRPAPAPPRQDEPVEERSKTTPYS